MAAKYETDLCDLAHVPLNQLLATSDTALARAYRRVQEELASTQEVVAGYVSVVDSDDQSD